MTICEELQDLYPAYVLDAVEDSDCKRIEAHLKICSNCAQAVEEYRPIAELLPLSIPLVEPPAELKYRVLAAAMPKMQPQARSVSFITQLSSFISSFFRSPAFSAVALGLVVALALWNVSLQNQITQQTTFNQQMSSEVTRQRALVSTIAYADSQPKRLQATDAAPQAIGRVYTAPELNAIALIVYDMPVLESQHVYQIWLIDPAGDRTSGGTFTVDERGRGWVYIRSPKPLNEFQGIGITVEPIGGSPKPTGAKMMGTSL